MKQRVKPKSEAHFKNCLESNTNLSPSVMLTSVFESYYEIGTSRRCNVTDRKYSHKYCVPSASHRLKLESISAS